jgi:hypothetical protein
MDPITLGVAAAGLFAAKVIERLGERSGDKAADSAGAVRTSIARLLGHRHGADLEPLRQVERTPDSRISIEALATAIAEAARDSPQAAQDLEHVVAESGWLRSSQFGAFQVSIQDDARVNRIYQANRDINIQEI